MTIQKIVAKLVSDCEPFEAIACKPGTVHDAEGVAYLHQTA
jgi:hypothetical protein